MCDQAVGGRTGDNDRRLYELESLFELLDHEHTGQVHPDPTQPLCRLSAVLLVDVKELVRAGSRRHSQGQQEQSWSSGVKALVDSEGSGKV